MDAQISAYGTLKNSLAEFQKILEPLSDNDTFSGRSVSFPETDVITPDAINANAQTGSFQIQVEKVAQAQTLVANAAYADKNSAINVTGNLTIKLGTWTYDGSNNPQAFAENEKQQALSIAVVAGDSLQDIADKINEADANVQATVVQVDGSYQLMMSAPSGAANALEVTGDDPSLDVFAFNAANYGNVVETQQGQNAEVKINGLTVYRETNKITDVIQGFDFTLNKASPGDKFTFSISEDKSTGEQAIRDFVEAYNSLYNTAKALTGVSTNEETNVTTRGDLSTDGAAKTVLSSLRGMVTGEVAGVSDFNALTHMGIRTKLDGTLEIIDSEFSAAIKNNFADIANVFAPQTSASTNDVKVTIGSYASKTVAGTYTGNITTAPAKGYVTGSALTFSAFDTSLGGSYGFSVNVDGTPSGALTLSGNFTTAEEAREALQAAINNDSALKEAKLAVDVTIGGSGEFVITSRQFGAASKVEMITADADLTTALGLSTASVSTAGADVAGTINGKSAFGAGEILLPPIDSDPYGLNLTVRENASGAFTFTYSRGLADSLSKLIDSFLQTNGAIQAREQSINEQITGLESDQEDLDRKMEIFERRLTAQYLAMEQIISSFQTTGNSLDGILDRLPFTASNN